MKVILLGTTNKLGKLGDEVKVKSGYARNYLIPQRKAVAATLENIKEFELHRQQLELEQADAAAADQARLEQLNRVAITVYRKHGEGDKLFGSVTANDIANTVKEAGVELEKNEVRLPKGPLRSLGEFDVTARLSTGIEASIKLYVVAENDKGDSVPSS